MGTSSSSSFFFLVRRYLYIYIVYAKIGVVFGRITDDTLNIWNICWDMGFITYDDSRN